MDDSQSLIQPALKVVDLNFTYSDGTAALQGINLKANPGESLAIIGPNGAGKSTLLLCLAGLLRAQGEIYFFGRRLTPNTARHLRKKIALVFQDPDDQLFMPTLEEDVAFGPLNLDLPTDEIERRVAQALTQMNLVDKKKKPPHHLSFGEKRRAALATALVMQAEIFLLDEPTSNLDPATRWELVNYLKALPVTRVVATHDLELCGSLCARCVLLSDGRQITAGPSEDIIKDKNLLRRYRLAPP